MVVCRFCGFSSEEVRCSRCGIVSTPQVSVDADVNAAFTDYSYNRYDETLLFRVYSSWLKFSTYLFSRNTISSKILNILFSPLLGGKPSISFSEHEHLLDVGCGRGFFLKFLPDNWVVGGCDIVNYADRPDNVQVGNFESIGFDKKYTIVRSAHSIEHSMYPKKFLDKIIEITKKNGVIVISSPNAESFSSRIFKSSWLPFNVDSHFCLLNVSSIGNHLESHGCRVIYKNTYTLFSSAGSLIEFLGIKRFQTASFVVAVILSLPIVFCEFLFNKGDSFVIYAKKV